MLIPNQEVFINDGLYKVVATNGNTATITKIGGKDKVMEHILQSGNATARMETRRITNAAQWISQNLKQTNKEKE